MALFVGTLSDEHGEYEYGHCFGDDEQGNEFGCGMEYAYRADTGTLEAWHDGVGLVMEYPNYTQENIEALEREHAAHMEEMGR